MDTSFRGYHIEHPYRGSWLMADVRFQPMWLAHRHMMWAPTRSPLGHIIASYILQCVTHTQVTVKQGTRNCRSTSGMCIQISNPNDLEKPHVLGPYSVWSHLFPLRFPPAQALQICGAAPADGRQGPPHLPEPLELIVARWAHVVPHLEGVRVDGSAACQGRKGR